jgi:NAD(P)-dependent dehydrogenase (short-subunit alcohol dehydrogenase family)
MSLAGKTAIVTGSSGGLGRAIVAELEKAGATPVGVDLGPAPAGASYKHYPCDITDAAAYDATIGRIWREAGPVHLLVNNAGYFNAVPFLDLTPQQVMKSMAVNVGAVITGIQAVARRMIAAGVKGSIVNIASISGEIGSGAVDYAASKAAVINLTKSVARDLAQHGIRVNAVAPGVIGAGMFDRLAPGKLDTMMAMTPLKRVADPAEIARVALFLATDAASYMTGTTVDVQGGY